MSLDWSIQLAVKDSAWFTANPTHVLLLGQKVYKDDQSGLYKLGDGVTQLSALSFLGGSSSVVWGDITGTVTNQTDLITYLWTNYQPLDSDLTSWAAITRASGFDTFATTPSSANLKSLVTDETGSGALVFGTSPTFTTQITTPLIYGSSLASGDLTLNSTSDATKGFVYIATSGGSVNIGNAVTTTQRILRIGENTAFIDFGADALNPSTAIISMNQNLAASSLNYTISGTSTVTRLNAPAFTGIQVGGIDRFQIRGVVTSGSNPTFTFVNPANTGQTASTNIPQFKVTGNTTTWAAGTLATQYFNYFSANTVAFASASTATDVYSFYIEKSVQGSLATITNNWALGLNGSVQISTGRLVTSQGADVASANNLVLGNDGNVFEITGTTQINLISNITWQNGSKITLLFTSNPTVKHNQATSTTNITIQLAGSVDFAATAGDTLSLVLCEIGGTQTWREISRAVI